jgi:hypothetical protein
MRKDPKSSNDREMEPTGDQARLPMRKDLRSSSDREMEPTGDRAGLPMRKDPRSSSDREMEPIGDRAGPKRLTCESLAQNDSKHVCVCEAR